MAVYGQKQIHPRGQGYAAELLPLGFGEVAIVFRSFMVWIS